MKGLELKPDIYWVGGIDWDLRNFHGYMTQRGSTYNAYIIKDEKIVLVDTVKHYMFDEMLCRNYSFVSIIIFDGASLAWSNRLKKAWTDSTNG